MIKTHILENRGLLLNLNLTNSITQHRSHPHTSVFIPHPDEEIPHADSGKKDFSSYRIQPMKKNASKFVENLSDLQ